MKKILCLLSMIFLFVGQSFSQGITGDLKGVVMDGAGSPIPFATVALLQNQQIITGVQADIDGNYILSAIPAGVYDMRVTSVGFQEKLMTNIIIKGNEIQVLNITLSQGNTQLYVVCCLASSPNLRSNKTQIQTNKENISKAPSTGITQPSIRGSRADALIYIDGVKTRGTNSLPQRAIQEVQVILGGTPPELGGATPPLPSAGNVQIYPLPSQLKPEVNYVAPATPTSQSYYPEYNAEEYKDFEDNDFLASLLNPLSTFSVDVDKASYSIVRRFINDRLAVPRGAVRLEEMVNYFDYNYPNPTDEHPFNIISELTDCPWNSESKIVKIALQGKRIDEKDLPPSVFTFLIDVSGSMQVSNKLPLVKASLIKLLDNMRPQDKVAIVVYAGAAGVVLNPTSANKKGEIVRKITEMEAGGSTAGGAGIQMAYKLAEENFIKEGNNRIILCTDGDFNVGISSDSELGDLIVKEREKGIFLTVLGYGMGNYKDSKLEMLADKGNGNYAYIDDFDEAEKFLGVEFAGSMYTIAKDVKIQVEFNPAIVKSYRLIGYENRILAAEDFNNDKKDAGEIGAGHTVTAIYEVRADEKFCKKIDQLKYQKAERMLTTTNSTEIASIKFRYKKPDGNESILINKTLENKSVALQNADESTRFALAVAAFGMTLRKSEYIKDLPLSTIILLASDALSYDKENREEFIKMMKAYARIGIAKQ